MLARPLAAAAARALPSAFAANVSPSSGGSSTSSPSSIELPAVDAPGAGEQARELAPLVLVAGRQQQPHRRVAGC